MGPAFSSTIYCARVLRRLLSFKTDQADLNFRRYDHPSTFVFRRKKSVLLYENHPHLKIYHLKTWTDCWAVLDRAIRIRDYHLFTFCLPEALKATLPEKTIKDLFVQFLKDPNFIQMVRHPDSFTQENQTWRLDLTAQ